MIGPQKGLWTFSSSHMFSIFYTCTCHPHKEGWKCWKTRMCINLDHVASGHFVVGETYVLCEFADYWPLAVSMPLTKLWPQCKAAVPVRQKTCERCDHVLRSKRKAECNLQEKAMKCMRAVESVALSPGSFPLPRVGGKSLVTLGGSNR